MSRYERLFYIVAEGLFAIERLKQEERRFCRQRWCEVAEGLFAIERLKQHVEAGLRTPADVAEGLFAIERLKLPNAHRVYQSYVWLQRGCSRLSD